MNQFKYQLHSQVAITASGETGTIIGRAEYTTTQNAYLVRYKSADGCAQETWWGEDALTSQ
jgi:hypothetical protein